MLAQHTLALGSVPAPQKPGALLATWLHGEFEASLGCMRLYFKKKKRRTQEMSYDLYICACTHTHTYTPEKKEK